TVSRNGLLERSSTDEYPGHRVPCQNRDGIGGCHLHAAENTVSISDSADGLVTGTVMLGITGRGHTASRHQGVIPMVSGKPRDIDAGSMNHNCVLYTVGSAKSIVGTVFQWQDGAMSPCTVLGHKYFRGNQG